MTQLKYTAEIELNEEQITAIIAKVLEVGVGDVTIRKRYDERTKTVQLTAIFKKTFEILPDKKTFEILPDKSIAKPMTVPYTQTDILPNNPHGLHATWTSSDALDSPNFTSTK